MNWLPVVFGLMLFVPATEATAAPKFNVYFVAVGNSDYAKPADAGASGLESLPGLNAGASLIAERLVERGARAGITLASREGHYLTVPDVHRAVSDVTARIKKERAPRPLLIVYVAGHGVAEGVGWNHFLFPGSFTYEGSIGAKDLEALSLASVHATSLVYQLNKSKIHYLLLLDACSEGKERSFEQSLLSSIAAKGLNSVMAGLRWLNEFRQQDPVLFSASPGHVVLPAEDPTGANADAIGPLARRFLIATGSASGKSLDLSTIIRKMVDPRLDEASNPAVTHAVPAAWWNGIVATSSVNGKIEEREGSAAASGRPCCLQTSSDRPSDADGEIWDFRAAMLDAIYYRPR